VFAGGVDMAGIAAVRRSVWVTLTVAITIVVLFMTLVLSEHGGSSPVRRFILTDSSITSTGTTASNNQTSQGQNSQGQNIQGDCNDNSQGNNNNQGCRPSGT
jgi:hypothetical protein